MSGLEFYLLVALLVGLMFVGRELLEGLYAFIFVPYFRHEGTLGEIGSSLLGLCIGLLWPVLLPVFLLAALEDLAAWVRSKNR